MNIVLHTFTDKWWDWERSGFSSRTASLTRALARNADVQRLLVVDVPSSVFVRAEGTAGTLAKSSIREVDRGVYVLDHKRLLPRERHNRISRGLNRALHDPALIRALRCARAELELDAPVAIHSGPLTAHLMGSLDERVSVYDAVDEWLAHPAFRSMRASISTGYARIRQQADLVVAVSEPLADRFRDARGSVRVLPNAVPAAWRDDPGAVPEDIRTLPRPMVGYVGALQERIDVDLVCRLAQRLPETSFCFLGPLLSPRHFASLRGMANVHFLGERRHEDVPAYVRAFDAALVPHVRSTLTECMDPIKLYEYVAAARPTIVSGIPIDARFRGLVRRCESVDEMVGALDAAASGAWRIDAGTAERFVADNSWDRRAEELIGFIDQVEFGAVSPLARVVGV